MAAKTVFAEADRRVLLNRLAALKVDARPQWGRMNASQMVAHLNLAVGMALGAVKPKAKEGLLRLPVIKQIVMFYLPWPKGVPTAPELIPPPDVRLADELDALRTSYEKVAVRPRNVVWPEHPAFGRLTPTEWGRLIYRHSDHHLRQFGLDGAA